MQDIFSKKDAILFYYPILLFLVGILIHVYNFFLISTGKMTLNTWNLWVQCSMLVYNITMLVGLLKRKKWAYTLSVVGLIGLTIFQGYFAFFSGIITAETIVSWVLCLLALPALIHTRSGI